MRDRGSAASPAVPVTRSRGGLGLSARKFEGKNLLAATHHVPLAHKVPIPRTCERQLGGSEPDWLETPDVEDAGYSSP